MLEIALNFQPQMSENRNKPYKLYFQLYYSLGGGCILQFKGGGAFCSMFTIQWALFLIHQYNFRLYHKCMPQLHGITKWYIPSHLSELGRSNEQSERTNIRFCLKMRTMFSFSNKILYSLICYIYYMMCVSRDKQGAAAFFDVWIT